MRSDPLEVGPSDDYPIRPTSPAFHRDCQDKDVNGSPTPPADRSSLEEDVSGVPNNSIGSDTEEPVAGAELRTRSGRVSRLPTRYDQYDMSR